MKNRRMTAAAIYTPSGRGRARARGEGAYGVTGQIFRGELAAIGPRGVATRQLTPKDLTERETEALAEYLIHGDAALVARCLGVTLTTVKNRLSAGYRKTGARTAAHNALLLGWVTLPPWSAPNHETCPHCGRRPAHE